MKENTREQHTDAEPTRPEPSRPEVDPPTAHQGRPALQQLALDVFNEFRDAAFVPYELVTSENKPNSGQYFSLLASWCSETDEDVQVELVHFQRTDFLDGHIPDVNRFFRVNTDVYAEFSCAAASGRFDRLRPRFREHQASFKLVSRFVTENSFLRDLLDELVALLWAWPEEGVSCDCMLNERKTMVVPYASDKSLSLYLPFDKAKLFSKTSPKRKQRKPK
jgi:hypothetical protein